MRVKEAKSRKDGGNKIGKRGKGRKRGRKGMKGWKTGEKERGSKDLRKGGNCKLKEEIEGQEKRKEAK